jgi:hypothetical protein
MGRMVAVALSRVRQMHWKAVVLGIAWTALLMAVGVWASNGGAPALWIVVLPWTVPGILLAVWGFFGKRLDQRS